MRNMRESIALYMSASSVLHYIFYCLFSSLRSCPISKWNYSRLCAVKGCSKWQCTPELVPVSELTLSRCHSIRHFRVHDLIAVVATKHPYRYVRQTQEAVGQNSVRHDDQLLLYRGELFQSRIFVYANEDYVSNQLLSKVRSLIWLVHVIPQQRLKYNNTGNSGQTSHPPCLASLIPFTN